MFKRLIIAALLVVASLACVSQIALATTYTTCERFVLPTPNDPAVANIWGTLLNTNFTLIDTAFGGTGIISVAGSSNVVLTANSGASDQSRSANFNFTGALTGNIYILFPQNGCGSFSVLNSTTGAFTLSVGVNNGSGVPVGVSVLVPQGGTLELVSDGTNVRQRVDLTGLGANAITQAAANTMVGNWTNGQTAAIANGMPNCADAGGQHLNYVWGTGVFCGAAGPNTGGYWKVYRTSSQSISTSTSTPIVMNNVVYDAGSFCNTSTGHCVPTLAGAYAVTCVVVMSGSSVSQNGFVAEAIVAKNGSDVQGTGFRAQSDLSSTPFGNALVTTIVQVNGSTDYLTCNAFSDLGSATVLSSQQQTYFTGNYLGP